MVLFRLLDDGVVRPTATPPPPKQNKQPLPSLHLVRWMALRRNISARQEYIGGQDHVHVKGEARA